MSRHASGPDDRQSVLLKARLKRGRRQRHVSVQRRIELERLWLARKIPQAHKRPLTPPFIGDCQLVAADQEGRPFPAIRRFHLDQSVPTVWQKAGNIEACTVAVLLRSPPTRFARSLRPRAARVDRSCNKTSSSPCMPKAWFRSSRP